jgi:hypothetical protein
MSTLSINIELSAIKAFLDKSLESVDSEMKAIFKREDAGEFTDEYDFENEVFFPMQREEITIKAVFNEINALVEWELAALAPNNVTDYPKSSKQPKKIKTIFDLKYSELCKRIEDYYKITIADMPGFTEMQLVRETINAFKHRKGFKYPRQYPDSNLTDKFHPTREDAYEAIDKASTFLRALIKECKKAKHPATN